MLSRFRMTVDDCIQEYETFAGEVFGKPRAFPQIRWYITKRIKFDYRNLEKAISDVIKRRRGVGEDDFPIVLSTERVLSPEAEVCKTYD